MRDMDLSESEKFHWNYYLLLPLIITADMFESVNKKTLIHPLCKVGFFNSKKTP